MKFVVLLLITLTSAHVVHGRRNKKNKDTDDVSLPAAAKLYKHLMDRYDRWNPDRVLLPRKNSSQSVTVTFGLVLQSFVDFDESTDVAEFETWENRVWTDDFMTWDPNDYEGIRSIRVTSDKIWTPDIELYNALHHPMVPNDPLLVVSFDGTILHVPPVYRKIMCSTNDTNLYCQMKFGSWTRDGSKLDLILNRDNVDVSSYQANKHYDLLTTSAVKNTVSYECCPEEYVDVTFKFEFKKNENSAWWNGKK